MCESLYNSLSTLQTLSATGDIDGLAALSSVNLVLAAISGVIRYVCVAGVSLVCRGSVSHGGALCRVVSCGVVSRLLSCRCSAMLDVELDAIYQLSYTAWQWIAWHLQSQASSSSSSSSSTTTAGDTTGHAMETVHTCGQVLRDFAACQLGKLSSSTATGVGAKGDRRTQVVQGYYYALVLLLQAYGHHLRDYRTHDIRVVPVGIAANPSTGQLLIGSPLHSASSAAHPSSSLGATAVMMDHAVNTWEKHVLQIVDLLTQVSEKDFFIAESVTDRQRQLQLQHQLQQPPPAQPQAQVQQQAQPQQQDYMQDLASVLCLGLEIVSPLLPLPILRLYPSLLHQYVSFVAYLCGGEVDGLVRWLSTRGHVCPAADAGAGAGAGVGVAAGTTHFQNLLWQLYEASVHSDVVIARQALQALQNVLQHQQRQLTTTSSPSSYSSSSSSMLLAQPYHREAWSLLLYEMTRSLLLFGMATSSSSNAAASATASATSATSSHGLHRIDSNTLAATVAPISADRIDSFSGCYLSLVVFVGQVDVVAAGGSTAAVPLTVDTLQTLQAAVHNILSNPAYSPFRTSSATQSAAGASTSSTWTPTMQTAVWTMLRQLFTERQVSLTSLDKRNRIEFTKNMCDFLRQLRSLSAS